MTQIYFIPFRNRIFFVNHFHKTGFAGYEASDALY